MRRALALSLTIFVLIAGCDGGDVVLVVDLRTDYLGGRHFAGVRTELGDPALDAVRAREDRLVSERDEFLEGERIAELRGLARGPVALRVTLVDAGGAPIATRTTLLTLSTQHALTVLVTSSCEGVRCPGAGDDPTLEACVGGRCVDPRCSPESPALCGPRSCAGDADCTSALACAEPVCIEGECFLRPEHDRCDASELCDVRDGCVLRPDADAGPGCPARETACGDALDEDCDGALDCADADCLGSPCDDASACTSADACAADGTCRGEAIACDDANPCTDDGCDPASGCTAANNGASCDDGSFCNGPDRCAGGACTAEGPAPCPSVCNEASRSCAECAVDPDCGSTSYTGWSACGSFAGACDTSGTESRTRTDRVCAAGACTSRDTAETRGCTRTVADGTSCGTTWQRCCAGVCTNLTTNAACGGCGVSCTAIGRTCASTGTGGYSCRGCTSNAECRSVLDSIATCYNVDAPPAWCQCQCPITGVCADAGCGAGMFCHACPGTNYCAPFGGSC